MVQQHVLDVVHVLVLVHQDIAIAVLQAFQHFGAFLQQVNGFGQQVVEVEGVVVAQFLLIDRVDFARNVVE